GSGAGCDVADRLRSRLGQAKSDKAPKDLGQINTRNPTNDQVLVSGQAHRARAKLRRDIRQTTSLKRSEITQGQFDQHDVVTILLLRPQVVNAPLFKASG